MVGADRLAIQTLCLATILVEPDNPGDLAFSAQPSRSLRPARPSWGPVNLRRQILTISSLEADFPMRYADEATTQGWMHPALLLCVPRTTTEEKPYKRRHAVYTSSRLECESKDMTVRD